MSNQKENIIDAFKALAPLMAERDAAIARAKETAGFLKKADERIEELEGECNRATARAEAAEGTLASIRSSQRDESIGYMNPSVPVDLDRVELVFNRECADEIRDLRAKLAEMAEAKETAEMYSEECRRQLVEALDMLAAAEAAYEDTHRLMCKQALGLQERRRRIEIAEADNAALELLLREANDAACVAGCNHQPVPAVHTNECRAIFAALASPHPGAAMLDAVRLAWDALSLVRGMVDGSDPWAGVTTKHVLGAVEALRPWAGKAP